MFALTNADICFILVDRDMERDYNNQFTNPPVEAPDCEVTFRVWVLAGTS